MLAPVAMKTHRLEPLLNPGSIAIVGASKPDQLRETAKAVDLVIDPALLAEAAAILEGVRIS